VDIVLGPLRMNLERGELADRVERERTEARRPITASHGPNQAEPPRDALEVFALRQAALQRRLERPPNAKFVAAEEVKTSVCSDSVVFQATRSGGRQRRIAGGVRWLSKQGRDRVAYLQTCAVAPPQ